MNVKKKSKNIYRCRECGHVSPKWIGKCPDCGQWDTFEEEAVEPSGRKPGHGFGTRPEPVPINAIDVRDCERFLTGIREFDRVLGGGVVPGSLVLIGGEPGIGKSTLILQVLHAMAVSGRKVLYVSGEESVRQIRMRSIRLSAESSGILVVSEIDVDAIIDMASAHKPDVLVIDSIQTLFSQIGRAHV